MHVLPPHARLLLAVVMWEMLQPGKPNPMSGMAPVEYVRSLEGATHYSINAQAPQAHTPQAHTPQAHTPQAHTPQAHTPKAHTPQAHNPQAHTPQAHTLSHYSTLPPLPPLSSPPPHAQATATAVTAACCDACGVCRR